MARPRPRTKAMTAAYNRTRAVQILTMRESLDTLTADALAGMVGLSVPECAALLEHARLLRGMRG